MGLLFWTFYDISPGVQCQGFPHVHASSPVCNSFLKFDSGMTPTDLLIFSLVAKPLVGFESGISLVQYSIIRQVPIDTIINFGDNNKSKFIVIQIIANTGSRNIEVEKV